VLNVFDQYDRVPIVAFCEHDDEFSGSKKPGNFMTSYTTINISRKTPLYGVCRSVCYTVELNCCE